MRYLLILTLLFCDVAIADWQDTLSDMTKDAKRRERLLEEYYVKEVQKIGVDSASLIGMHESFAICYAYASLGRNEKARTDARRYLAHHDAFAKAHSKVKGLNLLDLRVNGNSIPVLRLKAKRRIEQSIASKKMDWKLLNGVCGEIEQITIQINKEMFGKKGK